MFNFLTPAGWGWAYSSLRQQWECGPWSVMHNWPRPVVISVSTEILEYTAHGDSVLRWICERIYIEAYGRHAYDNLFSGGDD